ncbi:Nn.00g059500.m01.CDS01 [Neocucurbitaria sp. VM-36]
MSSVQPQWDLARTTIDAQLAIRELVRTCSMDDVQYQAVVAFENLGKRLLIHPSRFGPAIDALGGRKNEKLVSFGILVGFNGDGLPRTFRNSSGCLSAFNLVVACKTCCDNIEMANILHELMVNLGIYSTAPASPYQLVQLLSAISGYGDTLIPIQYFTDLSHEVLSRLTMSGELPGVLSALDSKAAAAVLAAVFAAIQNQQIDRVTLHGCAGGIWLATILLWLDPTMIQIIVKGTSLHRDNNCRLCLNLTPGDGWAINEWKAESNVSALIVPTENDVNTGFCQQLSLFPQRSAKAVLGTGTRQNVQLLGQLTGALVRIAVERGTLISQEAVHSNSNQLPRAVANHGLPKIRLADICQTDFLSKYETIAADFGWKVDDDFSNAQGKIVESILNFLDKAPKNTIEIIDTGGHHSTYLQRLNAVLANAEAATDNRKHELELLMYSNKYSQVLESAVNIAAEAIYFCLYKKDSTSPVARYMQGYNYKRTMQNAMYMWRLLFRPVHGIYGFSLSDLRRETFRSLLSVTDSGGSDQALIQANNGYVAFLNCLKYPSTQRRDCVAVCALPGAIRSNATSSPFTAVYQVSGETAPRADQNFSHSSPLEVWEGVKYHGLEPRCDPDAFEICHQVSTSERHLRVITFMRSRPLEASIALDWLRSIDAVAFAQRMPDSTVLSALAEENLATALSEDGLIFNDICWLSAGSSLGATNFIGYITMTYGDEILRFFTAGRLAARRLIIGKGPLMACIKVALDKSDAERSFASQVASFGSTLPYDPWVIIA